MNTRLPEKGQARWFVLILLLLIAVAAYATLRLIGVLTPPTIVPSQPTLTPTATLAPTETPTLTLTATQPPTNTPMPTLTPTVEPTATEIALVASSWNDAKKLAHKIGCLSHGDQYIDSYEGGQRASAYAFGGENPVFPLIWKTWAVASAMSDQGCVFVGEYPKQSGPAAAFWFEDAATGQWRRIAIQP